MTTNKLNQVQLSTLLAAKEYDLAIQYSVENNSIINMQIVLRAYGFPSSWDVAEHTLMVLSVEF